ncbi:MAG: DNA repair protein RadC [Verrucomicrobiaceae bacterium]|nr:DNA repair protein RadC [Verrucomicrobiaceae bacterium]
MSAAESSPSPNRIADLPRDDRPRERLLRLGPASLSDAELLALFINTGIPGENAIQVAQRLLKTHGSLAQLARLTPQLLRNEKALGPAKAALLTAAFEIGRRAERETLTEQPLSTPELIYQFAGPDMRHLPHETVRVLLVNTRLSFVRQEQISHGTVNESMAHPRDVLRPAIAHAAWGFILVHNHPSGDPSPSDADFRMTRRIREASEVLGIKFLDHVIIGAPSETRSSPYFSFREAGIL